MNNEDFLKHYGILGMRWGRRKGTVSTTVVRTRNSEDHDKRVAIRKKKIREMTNDELRTYTQRMALEKSYKELSKNDISLGKKIVRELMTSVTKGAKDKAMSYVTAQSGKMVEELLKKSKSKLVEELLKNTTKAVT